MAKKYTREVKQWITINGVHVPIYEGESKADAVKRSIQRVNKNVSKNEDDKANQLAKQETFRKAAEARRESKKEARTERFIDKTYSSEASKIEEAVAQDKNVEKAQKALKTLQNKLNDEDISDSMKRRIKERLEDAKAKIDSVQSDNLKNYLASKKKEDIGKSYKRDKYTIVDTGDGSTVYEPGGKSHKFPTDDEANEWINERENEKSNSKDSSSFSADTAAKQINDISRKHNNSGGDRENDWKTVKSILENAPVGTTMIQTGDRGVKFQHVKGEDGNWHGSWDSDSKTLSMGWVGQGDRPRVEFTTSDKALTEKQLKDSQHAANIGKLNQSLGRDKDGNKIGTRMAPKVDVSYKGTGKVELKGISDTIRQIDKNNIKYSYNKDSNTYSIDKQDYDKLVSSAANKKYIENLRVGNGNEIQTHGYYKDVSSKGTGAAVDAERGKQASRPQKYSIYDNQKYNATYLSDAISEMKRYERNWEGMTTREKKNIAPEGGKRWLKEQINRAVSYANIPPSFAAKYPNLTNAELLQKYKESLKNQRRR